MELCSNNHEEVCYSERDCPVCILLEEIEGLKQAVLDLEYELKEKSNA